MPIREIIIIYLNRIIHFLKKADRNSEITARWGSSRLNGIATLENSMKLFFSTIYDIRQENG